MPPKPEAKVLPPADDPAAAEDPITLWAARALEMVRKKASAEELDAWISDNSLDTVLNSQLAVLEMLTRCLIVAGAKSYTHMITALDRYYGPLTNLATSCGEEGEATILQVTTDVWATNPQRASMTIDRLMTLRLVSAKSIVSWVFQSAGLQLLQDESESGMAWEILYRAVDKTIVRVQASLLQLSFIPWTIDNCKYLPRLIMT